MFNLSALLEKERVFFNLKSRNKKALVKEMIECAAVVDDIADEQEELVKAILNRERLESTGIGLGAAIPHCHYKGFKYGLRVYVGFPSTPVEFKSFDGSVTRVVFMIISDAMDNERYLQAISRLMHILKNAAVIENIFTISSSEEFIDLIANRDKNLDFVSYKGVKQLMSLIEVDNAISVYYSETMLDEGKRKGAAKLREDEYYAILKKSREELINSMEHRLSSIYKQLISKYKSDIFSKIQKNVCSCCNVQLPIHILREIDRHNMIIQCRNCAKILIR